MGGTRFNGLHLVWELERYGHNVTILNRGMTEAYIPRNVRRLYADRKDHNALREVLAGEKFDVIFDISAYVLDDVKGIVDIISGRVGHYIFASSTVVYGATNILPITEDFPLDSTEQQSQYGIDKIICEEYLIDLQRKNRFPATIARFSMVFGPDNNLIDREQRMFTRLLKGREILIPGRGTTLGQVGHVDDEARALRLMAMNPRTFGEIYNITGKDYFSDEGYVDTCAEALGINAKKLFVPANVMDEIYLQYAPGYNGDRQLLIQKLAPYIHYWDRATIFSIDKLCTHLSFDPFYTFRTAVEQTYEWFVDKNIMAQRNYDFSKEDELINRLS